MTELPPAPEGGQQIIVQPVVERKTRMWPVFVFVALFVGAIFALFTYLRPGVTLLGDTVRHRAAPTVSPEAPFELDEALIQDRMDQVAVYLGAGNTRGAQQVTEDLIGATDCEVAFAEYAAYEDQAAADEALQTFRAQSMAVYADRPTMDFTVVSATAPITDREAFLEASGDSDGKFGTVVGLGFIVGCPR